MLGLSISAPVGYKYQKSSVIINNINGTNTVIKSGKSAIISLILDAFTVTQGHMSYEDAWIEYKALTSISKYTDYVTASIHTAVNFWISDLSNINAFTYRLTKDNLSKLSKNKQKEIINVLLSKYIDKRIAHKLEKKH